MSRKYRHQGYQDNDRDRDERPRSRPTGAGSLTPEERAQRRGLRHALDREAREVMRCHACGRGIDEPGVVGTAATCPSCNADLHCCRACLHFDTSARWQCKTDIPKPVPEKSKNNACESFRPRLVLDATGKRTPKRGPASNDPKSMFDSLFKR